MVLCYELIFKWFTIGQLKKNQKRFTLKIWTLKKKYNFFGFWYLVVAHVKDRFWGCTFGGWYGGCCCPWSFLRGCTRGAPSRALPPCSAGGAGPGAGGPAWRLGAPVGRFVGTTSSRPSWSGVGSWRASCWAGCRAACPDRSWGSCWPRRVAGGRWSPAAARAAVSSCLPTTACTSPRAASTLPRSFSCLRSWRWRPPGDLGRNPGRILPLDAGPLGPSSHVHRLFAAYALTLVCFAWHSNVAAAAECDWEPAAACAAGPRGAASRRHRLRCRR